MIHLPSFKICQRAKEILQTKTTQKLILQIKIQSRISAVAISLKNHNKRENFQLFNKI